MTDLDELVARLLVEERWAHLYARGNRDEASDRSALLVARGGLGRRLHPATLKARVRSYDAKKARRLQQQREDERERLIAEAEYAVVDADRRLAALAAGGDVRGYSIALRAYKAAEATLDRRRTEHVPLARWMRESDEIDVALTTLEALRFADAVDRARLVLSLSLTAFSVERRGDSMQDRSPSVCVYSLHA